jgi:A/G-specific adenine glycosylase
MDLGATICVARAPRCLLCPVRDLCAAAKAGTQERYPVKSRRGVRSRRDNAWLELRWRGQVWLLQRPARGVWAGLWSLPEFDSIASLQAATAGWPGRGEALPPFVHVLTHFDWHLQPLRWTLPAATSARGVARLTVAGPRAAGFRSTRRWRSACRRLCASGSPAG